MRVRPRFVSVRSSRQRTRVHYLLLLLLLWLGIVIIVVISIKRSTDPFPPIFLHYWMEKTHTTRIHSDLP